MSNMVGPRHCNLVLGKNRMDRVKEFSNAGLVAPCAGLFGLVYSRRQTAGQFCLCAGLTVDQDNSGLWVSVDPS